MEMQFEPWHIWTMVAVTLFIGEVFMPNFILASLGVGCLVGAGAHQVTGELGWGIGGFVVGAGASLAMIRPYVATLLGPEKAVNFGADAMVGDTLTVTDAGDVGGSLKGRYRDTLWSLKSDTELFEGDQVVITAVEAGTLIVAPVGDQAAATD